MTGFAARLLAWFDRHGRKDLPWQRDPSPYRVWVSEIMLQQTQVDTVRGYYSRFVERFPDVTRLAGAGEDEVLALWSGLGYYARARNLHAAAKHIATEHAGEFPGSLEAVMALPGIGRSTAGAILALSRGEAHAVLDGNVKRVLARHGAIDGWPGRRAVEARLWEAAQGHLPRRRLADYTQALMDLGATVCTPRQPACRRCPVAADCRARILGRPHDYPSPRPRRTLAVRRTVFLMARRADGALLLERRPAAGIWGGLWCFPECADDGPALCEALARRGLKASRRMPLAPLRHTFSHFHLDIQPVLVEVHPHPGAVSEVSGDWFMPHRPEGIGLAAAVVRLLDVAARSAKEYP